MMTDQSPRIPSGHDPDKYRRLLETAAGEFARVGFERANVNTIAERAGVGKGTVYFYFAGKSALFKAVLAELRRRLAEALPTTAATDPAAGLPVGMVSRSLLELVPAEARATTTVTAVMVPPPAVLQTTTSLDGALETLAGHSVSWLPFVDGESRVTGVASIMRLARTSRRMAARGVRRAGLKVDGAAVFEVRATEQSPLVAAPLRALALPGDVTVVSVRRHGEVVLTPRAKWRLYISNCRPKGHEATAWRAVVRTGA
jgi:AcrR family transcriptional regulator